jgi:hypothetical protein
MAQELPLLISHCPRCGVKKITFIVLAAFQTTDYQQTLFCRCRECFEGTTFEVRTKRPLIDIMKDSAGAPANYFFDQIELQKPKFNDVASCPEFVPDKIEEIFEEAATCRAIGCFSASGAMYRKVIDQATRTLVDAKPEQGPNEGNGISWKEFKDLRLRLNWLIKNGNLPNGIDQLVECVREEENDAAHALESIGHDGAADLEDFSKAILEFLFTMPGKISRNIDRRADRRGIEAGK